MHLSLCFIHQCFNIRRFGVPAGTVSLCRYGLLAMVLALSAPLAAADSIDELRALVEANDSTAAWDMAQRLEPENAGEPDFDFWYALAAKAAGQKNQAVFALDRVIANQPDNSRAKLELADVYYQFGNAAGAKGLFEQVLASTPPDAVQQNIRTYLAAMAAVEQKRGTQVSGFVTIAGGYDSNINNATSVPEHDVVTSSGPLTFALTPASLATDTGFMDVRTGLNMVQPVNNRQIRFLNLSLQSRDNADIFSGDNYDYAQLAATGGWLLRRGSAQWRFPVNVQALTVQSDESRYTGTVGVEYSRPLAANTALSWFGQAGAMHYPAQQARNASLALVGGAYTWNGKTTPLRMVTSLHLGTEPTEDSSADFNGRDYVAVRVNLRYAYADSMSLYGGLGAQQSQYQGDHPVLGFAREETLADIAIGWQWQPDRRWSVNADLSAADNASSGNNLFDFRRTQVMLGSTWHF